MNILKGCVFFLLGVILFPSCVSYTERLPYHPHQTPQDEGVWAEVKREFGWSPSRKTKKLSKGQGSLAARMVQSVKGWFADTKRPVGPDMHPRQWERIHQEYEQEQKKLGLY